MIMKLFEPMIKTERFFTTGTSNKADIFTLIGRATMIKVRKAEISRSLKEVWAFGKNSGFEKRILPHVYESRCTQLIMNKRMFLKFTVSLCQANIDIMKENMMIDFFDESFPDTKSITVEWLSIFGLSNRYRNRLNFVNTTSKNRQCLVRFECWPRIMNQQ